jgi:hypothetical protein
MGGNEAEKKQSNKFQFYIFVCRYLILKKGI